MPTDTPILEVDAIVRHFGGLQAVDGCSFAIQKGMLAALIGPNGAGKTTLVNLVAGALPLHGGRVLFEGTDISGWPPHRIAARGLVRTFQISREWAQLTVLENLLVAAPGQQGEQLWNALLRPSVGRQQDRKLVARALDTLDTFGLYAMRNEYAVTLSGGQKRLLELARAVMSQPKMLLLDEPMAGVNPALTEQLAAHIESLRQGGITFLLVEHNLEFVEQSCDHVVVMALGRTLATGVMAELRTNPEVVGAYLGGDVVERAAG
ncbi:MAG TPA: ABC transporter ATP-binding protein [Candidatus Micrarchaeia archaeon]|nr:ABC transporter ATP-binding protein [Candidatus Micrarchaeia archaeon]